MQNHKNNIDGKQCRHCRLVTGLKDDELNDENAFCGCGRDGHIVISGDPACKFAKF